MPNNNNFVGRVYYYISNWLKENKNGVKEPHYTPIVLEDCFYSYNFYLHY